MVNPNVDGCTKILDNQFGQLFWDHLPRRIWLTANRLHCRRFTRPYEKAVKASR